ncbi:MAG: hypothetical protein MUP30_07880 [Deltaproteobacteria bacterium]|nr:hypothetical protein [Deltaproteobacteria bacterium]
MDRGIKYWLRWLVVLPGAIAAGVLAMFPLHWILYSTLRHFVEPYPQLPERMLTPFVIAAVFVWAGSRIAPEYKAEAAVVLFGLWMALLGGFVFLTLSGSTWMGRELHFQGGGVAPVMAFVGAVTGLCVVRKEHKAGDPSHNTPLKPPAEKRGG